jgi:3-methyladenine DNA glycosylase AlkD
MNSAGKLLLADFKAQQNPEFGLRLQSFFKTGKGEYGEGDMFLGLRVPQTRVIVKAYYDVLTLDDFRELLDSKWHEVRLAAVIAMRAQFIHADAKYQKQLYDLYVAHVGRGINNWDIIDISCPHIVGAYLYSVADEKPLYELAKGNLWQKRVSIISTFWHLKYKDPTLTYTLAETLVNEKHDLLQKAVGWSLREMGKQDGQLLRQFLDKHAATMPRTALRYAIEKFEQTERNKYMSLRATSN